MFKKKNLFNLVTDSCFQTNNNEQVKPTPFKYGDAENKFNFLLRNLREEVGNDRLLTQTDIFQKRIRRMPYLHGKLQNLLIRITVKNIT